MGNQKANPCALAPSGTLTSVTNLATSLARNMDRLSLDEEHYKRQEEWRRRLPESLGEGLRQGLSRLGISLLGKGLQGTCAGWGAGAVKFSPFLQTGPRRGGCGWGVRRSLCFLPCIPEPLCGCEGPSQALPGGRLTCTNAHAPPSRAPSINPISALGVALQKSVVPEEAR